MPYSLQAHRTHATAVKLHVHGTHVVLNRIEIEIFSNHKRRQRREKRISEKNLCDKKSPTNKGHASNKCIGSFIHLHT